MNQCWTTVGDPPLPMLVDIDVLTDAVETLAEQFRLEGKTGAALDGAIRWILPMYLDTLLFGTGETFH
jgi:hypothetical protein